MAVARHALTWRSKGQLSRSHGYENRHGCLAPASGMGMHVVWLLRLLIHLNMPQCKKSISFNEHMETGYRAAKRNVPTDGSSTGHIDGATI